MLHQPERPMVIFSKKLNSFSGEAAQHGRPLQTPPVSLINLDIIKYSDQHQDWCEGNLGAISDFLCSSCHVIPKHDAIIPHVKLYVATQTSFYIKFIAFYNIFYTPFYNLYTF